MFLVGMSVCLSDCVQRCGTFATHVIGFCPESLSCPVFLEAQVRGQAQAKRMEASHAGEPGHAGQGQIASALHSNSHVEGKT